jgi:DNA-binding Xre family transcriptional regulator
MQAGVQRQTINRLENGGEAEMPTVRKIAEALKCEPRQLIEPDVER